MRLQARSDEELLKHALGAASEQTYWNNLRELRSRMSTSVFEMGVALTRSSIQKERVAGIDLLSQAGGRVNPFRKEILAIYFELLGVEENREAQASILYGIGHNNARLSIAGSRLVAAFVGSGHRSVRRATVQALLGVENDVAINALIALSGDKYPEIRNWATFGLGEQIETDTENIRDALWARVTDRHADTRAEAIRGLAKRNDQRVIPVMKTQLASGTFGALLFDAIAATGDGSFLPQLLRLQQDIENEETVSDDWRERLGACIRTLESTPR